MDRNRHRRSISALAAAIAAVVVITAPVALARQGAPIVLFTSKEQIPLKAYAEFMRSGILQLVSGSPKDIPTVSDVSYFRCGLTGWSPKGVLVASEELFRSEYAERRLLPLVLKLYIYEKFNDYRFNIPCNRSIFSRNKQYLVTWI